MALTIISGEIAAQPLNDNFSEGKANLDTHLAEVASYLVIATRDISLEGNQTIALIGGRIPKKITISALVGSSVHASWGAVASNSQGGMAQIDTGNMTVFSSVGVFIRQSSGNFTSGAVLMEIGQITITWTKTGTPTGTASLIITADYHD